MSSTLRSSRLKAKKSLFSTDIRIKPYEYKGLHGRYVHLPAKSPAAKRTFIILYGHHATLERIIPIAETLSEYGDVYMPDNPGFGGMDSSYKIGQKANLEFFAGHLKYFIDNYVEPSRLISIMGISFGFQIAVDFVHRYPEYEQRIENLVSFAGFVSPRNIGMSPGKRILFKYLLGKTGKSKLGAAVMGLAINDFTITKIYQLTWKQNVRFDSIPPSAVDEYIAGQVMLWKSSDHRTHAQTGFDFFGANELSTYRFNDLSLIHVGIPRDHFINDAAVRKDMKLMFKKVLLLELDIPSHAPLDLDTPAKIKAVLPHELLEPLTKSKNLHAVI